MTYKSGQWKATCDRCGFEFLASDLKKDWQGLMVCNKDFELRNPQDFIKVKPERITPPWTRPEPPDVFVLQQCNVVNSQAIVGTGIAGCMVAGKVSPGLV
jgi:hypothetical protein